MMIVTDGFLVDYISGEKVKATPEEVDAVQVFSKRLVEDYDYPKTHIQTRPQYRVKKLPSEITKSYPVDIAVFKSDNKIDNEVYMITECKSKTEKKGEQQLKLYMDMSSAEIGVWFNGESHLYLRKILHQNGTRTYSPLPNIPRFGQRIQDIGLFTRKDLKKPSNLKAVFKDIRNHLAGMTTGITRDEALAKEIINILFCKILDERERGQDETVRFRAGIEESSEQVKQRIIDIFEDVKGRTYGNVFETEDSIKLDSESLVYVVGELQNYCITESDRDAVGDAFEVFIGPALRGSEGQFFTPRNVVHMIINILEPQPYEKIIDPACGSGGFLINTLDHVWKLLKEEAVQKGWTERTLFEHENQIASNYFHGIDKDSFLAKVSKAYMALVGDGRGGIFCENSLVPPSDWSQLTQEKVKLGTYDIVITNPPFGKKIVVEGQRILSQYELGYKWKLDKETNLYHKTAKIYAKRPPQIVFLERCIQLLRPGGRMGIVLPESLFGMPTHGYVVAYLKNNVKIRGIVSMPEPLFKTSGKGGTHTKVCVVFIENTSPDPDDVYDVFMADVLWCGHDSRSNPTLRKLSDGTTILMDDVPKIAPRYKELMDGWE